MMTVVILAAGYGLRMKHILAGPKALAKMPVNKVLGRILGQNYANMLTRYNGNDTVCILDMLYFIFTIEDTNRIILVTNDLYLDTFTQYIRDNNMDIQIVSDGSKSPDESMGVNLNIAKVLKMYPLNDFLFLSSDSFYSPQILELFRNKYQTNMLFTYRKNKEDLSTTGCVIFEGENIEDPFTHRRARRPKPNAIRNVRLFKEKPRNDDPVVNTSINEVMICPPIYYIDHKSVSKIRKYIFRHRSLHTNSVSTGKLIEMLVNNRVVDFKCTELNTPRYRLEEIIVSRRR